MTVKRQFTTGYYQQFVRSGRWWSVSRQ